MVILVNEKENGRRRRHEEVLARQGTLRHGISWLDGRPNRDGLDSIVGAAKQYAQGLKHHFREKDAAFYGYPDEDEAVFMASLANPVAATVWASGGTLLLTRSSLER